MLLGSGSTWSRIIACWMKYWRALPLCGLNAPSMSQAYARNTILDGVDLTNGILDRIDLTDASLKASAAFVCTTYVLFTQDLLFIESCSCCQGAKLVNAVITGTIFDGANLTDTNFEDAVIGETKYGMLCEP